MKIHVYSTHHFCYRYFFSVQHNAKVLDDNTLSISKMHGCIKFFERNICLSRNLKQKYFVKHKFHVIKIYM